MSHMPVLHALQDGGSLSQKDLARFARVEQPTMAELLGRMERDGVVQREPNPEDGRGSLTSLTRKARARWPKAKGALMQGEHDATAGFSAEEKAQLISLLQRVLDNLEKT
jgi:DNA-binding MarR family transcriptional regulator